MGGCASKKLEDDEYNNNEIMPIIIETQTWKRDSHGLFDYETHDVIKKTLKIVGNTQIYRNNDSLEMSKCKYQSNKKDDIVLDVTYEPLHYKIQNHEDGEEQK